MPATVADWITYAAARGTTVAAGAAADQALVRASDYIRTRYLLKTGMSAEDAAAIEATYIAAGFELATPGFWSGTFTAADQKILTGLGELKWTPIASNGMSGASAVEALLPTSPAIDALLLTNEGWGLPAVMVV